MGATAPNPGNAKGRPFTVYQRQDIDAIAQLRALSRGQMIALKAVSAVLPFRVNSYVVEELIDWKNIPDDPMYQLVFPQKGMLASGDFRRMADLVAANAGEDHLLGAAREIQFRLNPHPAGQMDLNVPKLHSEPVPGMQHKYRETVLFFPSPGQTCFAYCTYCFRWAQFVGIKGLQFACREASVLVDYLKEHREVQSVLFTGGDPLIMKTALIRKYIEPLLTPELAHVTSIRIGTKALPYWPYRFVGDDDADDLLRLFQEVRKSGRQLAIMSHYSHPIEMETEIAQLARQRVQDAGAIVRSQAPVVRHVNDDPAVWSKMWQMQVRQGVIPYYMFVERDTGARNYFEVPLARCLEIFQKAYSELTGLGRTVRGPSMSCIPGKVMVDGIQEIAGEKVFALKFLQARDPAWVNQLFFAKFDARATWMDQLKPAFGDKEFFFAKEMQTMKETGFAQVWLHPDGQHSLAA